MSLHLSSSPGFNAAPLPQHSVGVAPLYPGLNIGEEPDFVVFVTD